MLFLVRPTVRYKSSFLTALQDFHAESYFVYQDAYAIANDFPAFVERLLSESTTPRPGLVPESHYWLIRHDETSDAFVARGTIRHTLNSMLVRLGGHIGYAVAPSERCNGYGTVILRLLLNEAKDQGIDPVLITCDDDNIGSRKIIEKNGGIFENAVPYNRNGSTVLKRRYWIDV
jgi:predicted acetyltransferase